MQKNANETAKETKNMFLQSAKELKAVTTLAACAMFAADFLESRTALSITCSDQ